MKYAFIADSIVLNIDEPDEIVFNDLFYPDSATANDKIEIDKDYNDIINKLAATGKPADNTMVGYVNNIKGQINTDKQIKVIKNSGDPSGIVWFIRAFIPKDSDKVGTITINHNE